MSDRPPPGLWSIPGDGLLVRQGSLVLIAELVDTRHTDGLLEVLRATEEQQGDGRQLADAVEDLLTGRGAAAHDPEQPLPGLVTLGPTGRGLTLTVSGAAWAEITTRDGMRRITAGQPHLLLRCALTSPVLGVQAGLRDSLADGDHTDRLARLDSGTVRAGGFSYRRAGRHVGRPEPEPTDRPPPVSGVPVSERVSIPAAEPAKVSESRLEKVDAPGVVAVPGPAAPEPGGRFDAVLLVGPTPEKVEARRPLPVARAERVRPEAIGGLVDVLGVYCRNGHFDDPRARVCAVCGISMTQQTQSPRHGPRPPLGLLVVDDGTVYQLDADYVVGREPTLAPSVTAGSARQLRIMDDGAMVSRIHAGIHLDGWLVLITDLGSANGTSVRQTDSAEAQRLVPQVATPLQPGSLVNLGGRGLRYVSHRGR